MSDDETPADRALAWINTMRAMLAFAREDLIDAVARADEARAAEIIASVEAMRGALFGASDHARLVLLMHAMRVATAAAVDAPGAITALMEPHYPDDAQRLEALDLAAAAASWRRGGAARWEAFDSLARAIGARRSAKAYEAIWREVRGPDHKSQPKST